MLPKNRNPTHPGEMLLEEFLKPGKITQKAFAAHIGITTAALSELIKGKRSITVNTAQRISMALGTTPQLWLNLQQNYDLATAPKVKKKISVLDLSEVMTLVQSQAGKKKRKTRRKSSKALEVLLVDSKTKAKIKAVKAVKAAKTKAKAEKPPARARREDQELET